MFLNWRIMGASVAGTSHEKNGIPCQDSHAYQFLAGSSGVAIAVSDGAGTAERSAEGSGLAVREAVAVLAAAAWKRPQTEAEWTTLLNDAFRQARSAVLSRAELFQLEPALFNATLTCVVLFDGWLVVGQVGDGLVVAQTEEDELWVAARPVRGEYANETMFLTGETALDNIQMTFQQRPVQALAVLSDGLIRLAMDMPTGQAHRPFFQPLFAFAAASREKVTAEGELTAFLSSERVNTRTDDDKTLVLLAREMRE
jgi:hypothetical protein